MNRLSPAPMNQAPLVLENYNRRQDKASGSGIKRFVFFGLFVVFGFAGGSVYWAAESKLDGAVVAPASLVVEGNRKTVEHLEGGIIRTIFVTNGDVVEAGQTLVELDSTDLNLDLDVLASQLGDLTVRRARLLAQIKGEGTFSEATASGMFRVDVSRDSWANSYLTQKQLFDAEIRTRSSEEDLLAQRIAGLEEQMSGLRAQRESNARQVEITQEELSNLRTLLAKGLVAAARVNSRRIEIERLTGLDASLKTQEAQASNQITELRLTGLGQQTLRDEESSNELTVIEAQLATIEPQYARAIARLGRVAITAPVSGRIVDLQVFTQGGVITPGAPILDIVPGDEPLVVEARVNTADIEKLFVGQTTRVRLSAFDQNEVPEASGVIVGISADSLEDGRTGQPYYVARVKFDADQPEQISKLELLPGMPADLFVNTGERTALSYLAQPLQARLARTFIE